MYGKTHLVKTIAAFYLGYIVHDVLIDINSAVIAAIKAQERESRRVVNIMGETIGYINEDVFI